MTGSKGACLTASRWRFGDANLGDWISGRRLELRGIIGFYLRGGAQPILSVQTLGQSSKSPGLHVVKKDPLFVLGSHGRGQVGALMTDLAPHWVGGLVDWGKRRIRIQLTHKVGIEIGENYLKFVTELIHLMLQVKGSSS